MSAERSLAAEFPPQVQARKVLTAIGSGERTFTNIARAVGGIGAIPLQRVLELLTDKRIVASELPVSLRPSKDRRYRVTDPYLRFWLHVLGPSMEEIERGRGDLTLARIRDNWTSWRGRAVEPLVREALARILPDDDLVALHRHRAALTDEPVPVVAVSRSGVDCPGLDATYGPGDLLTAWPL